MTGRRKQVQPGRVIEEWVRVQVNKIVIGMNNGKLVKVRRLKYRVDRKRWDKKETYGYMENN